ncbi:hypothetical protein NPIL_520961 [Nephila pilipes]|uniref:Uncharacterized protein n=1 Tax=Nephila pilipes TaxID=299642 RepID=A0A8X6NHA0_NEPPI|nr:hypothetical protein NPIL_520961 [Nephila pilipes]
MASFSLALQLSSKTQKLYHDCWEVGTKSHPLGDRIVERRSHANICGHLEWLGSSHLHQHLPSDNLANSKGFCFPIEASFPLPRINHGFVAGEAELADCCYQGDAKGLKRPHLCLCHPRGSSYCGRVGVEQWGMSTDQRDDHRLAKWPSVYLHPDVIGIALISCHHLFGLKVGTLTMRRARGKRDHFIARVERENLTEGRHTKFPSQ